MTAATRPADPPVPHPERAVDLSALFHEHHARVLQAAYRVTGNAGDAEDVLQTVFLRLLHRGPGLDLAPHPGAYLHRAAVNAALDLVRARKRAGAVDLEPLAAALPAGAADGPEAAHREAELLAFLRDAVARLQPPAGEVFALHAFEGLSHDEIARTLGLTPNGVAVLLHRTRRRLRDQLSGRDTPDTDGRTTP